MELCRELNMICFTYIVLCDFCILIKCYVCVLCICSAFYPKIKYWFFICCNKSVQIIINTYKVTVIAIINNNAATTSFLYFVKL